MVKFTLSTFLSLWILVLIIDDLNKTKQLETLRTRYDLQERKMKMLIEDTDNEIAFYMYKDNELTTIASMLVKTVLATDLKQTKTKEVRNIIRNTITSLPDTDEYLAAKNLNSTDISRIAKYIVEYSDQYEIPLSLAVALIKQESAFNFRAVSRTGAQGLAQLMPSTAEVVKKQLGKTEYDPWDTQNNIQFGLFYFSTLLDLYKDRPEQYRLAVNAYNAGPGNVFKVLRRETIQHETYIFRYASEFREQGL